MRQRPFPKYIAMGGVMTAVIGWAPKKGDPKLKSHGEATWAVGLCSPSFGASVALASGIGLSC